MSSLRHRFCTATSNNVLDTATLATTPRRQRYPTASMDMNRLASLSPSHGHDFQPKNKLIMVRKTEKRTFAEGKQGEAPTLRTVTRTTVQTFDGNNKVLRKVTKQKKSGDETDKETRTPGSNTPGAVTPGTPATCGTATPANGTTTPGTASNTPLTLNKSNINGACVATTNGDASIAKKEQIQSATRIPQPVTKIKGVNGINGASGGTDGSITPTTHHLRERQQNDAGGTGQIRQDFASECLLAHNEYRRLHGVPELKLDRKLCRYSQEWADHLGKVKTTSHRPNSDYGENIFFFWSSNPRERVHGRDPVDNWYKEIEKHTFGVEPKTLISGHMTQVLWKTSQRLGVGVARNTDGQTYVVCNYDPAGNYVGTYARNVPPIGGFEEEDEENFVDQALRLHNEYRARHSSPPLSINTQLCAFAQDWADTLARTRTFHHRPSNPYGENLFAMRSSDQVTAADACTSWYSEEVKFHSYGQEPSRLDPPAGHFTQMVWKETELMGIGRATTECGQVVIVANYHPRGD
ncbi:uncharacterized protein LOC142328952 isoform X2 [Lycorma delicatula]|uniref:uncharacterized protein LOC142328952 isoform X2 n=1 Tax=Lycorma delicatula TaxID=130591 RepID=UPI003F50DF74